MKNLIEKLEKEILILNDTIVFKNDALETTVYTSKGSFADELKHFATSFNNLFKSNKSTNLLNAYIVRDDKLFSTALELLNDDILTTTPGLKCVNQATISTSIAKCTQDTNYYLMRCYDYFIYIFDKSKQRCYMLIKNNKKVLTMINILILTPYLMYGELFAVHGGLVNKDNKNVLINNSSLGGKTTFAILFAGNGWDIITEETTYITNDGKILPFNIRNYFNIRAGTYLNFYDFFREKNIIINNFINMKDKSFEELYALGKLEQESIDFERIGKFKELKIKHITHSLNVSIKETPGFIIESCSPVENVKSFLELSLAPTVLLFKELLNYNSINTELRKEQLISIFKNTNSYKIISDFNYKSNFDNIINKI